jgi:hypothetical protein
MARSLYLALAVSLCLPVAPVRAQCPDHWLPGQGLPGVNGYVYAMTTWDPDGPGPQPELLVVGGFFGVAGEVLAANIAAWDGVAWHPLGSGMNGSVEALTVHEGQLIAGGEFTTAGGVAANYIARWDGTEWHPLGSGMGGGDYPYVCVYDLTVHDGQLVVGGIFFTAGDQASAYLARWGVVPGDLSCDDAVDPTDLALFAPYWLEGNCAGPGWCAGADLNEDTAVDLLDFARLAGHWLWEP